MKSVITVCGFCLLIAIFVSGPISASGQARFTRTILGVVVDKEDMPVVGARVCAYGNFLMGGILPCGESNSQGRFSIAVDRKGTYTITADQLALGYPKPICGFYGKRLCNFPVVTIDDTNEVTPVKIWLGEKAGRVLFTIVDEDTHEPITKGMIGVCRVGEPLSCWYMSTAFPNGRFELLTPDAPFTVSFQTWELNAWVIRAAFDASSVPIKVLQVNLGEQKEITVRLK